MYGNAGAGKKQVIPAENRLFGKKSVLFFNGGESGFFQRFACDRLVDSPGRPPAHGHF
jgi:hypothetical protein